MIILIIAGKSFTILHSEESILRQLRVAQSKLDLMPHLSLRQGMEIYLRDLGFVHDNLIINDDDMFDRDRVKAAVASTENGRIPLSFDYVIVAEPCLENDTSAKYNSADADQPGLNSDDHAEGGPSKPSKGSDEVREATDPAA